MSTERPAMSRRFSKNRKATNEIIEVAPGDIYESCDFANCTFVGCGFALFRDCLFTDCSPPSRLPNVVMKNCESEADQ